MNQTFCVQLLYNMVLYESVSIQTINLTAQILPLHSVTMRYKYDYAFA